MDEIDLINEYNERYKKFGYSSQTLGWNKNRANHRFEQLSCEFNFDNSSVLDFGCGFGDFYSYLKKNNSNFNYTGIDINPLLIEEGLKVYGDIDLRVINIFKEKFTEKFDYIICSGTFNFNLGNNYEYLSSFLRIVKNSYLKGLAANFLSTKAEIRYPKNFYYDPYKTLDMFKKNNEITVLREDFFKYEFCVFSINKELNIKNSIFL